MVGLNEANTRKSEEIDSLNMQYEQKALDWMADMLDLPEKFRRINGAQQAIYTSAGDSFLNVALAAKNRQRMLNPDKNLVDKQVGYLSMLSNSAVERSVKFSNLRVNCIKDTVKCEIVDDFPIYTEYLENLFEEDIRKGLTPTLFILTLGSTPSLSIENIKDITTACKKYDVWVHVDAAQLGVYAIVPEYRYLLNDVELTDSFSTNASKSLCWGMGSNFCYVAHKDYCKWLTYKTEPMHDTNLTSFSADDNSNMHITNPNQNNARRIVMTLMSWGKEGIINEFRRHFALADYFRELMSEEKNFELLKTKNSLNMVLFRLKDKSNDETADLLDTIISWDKIFLVLSTVHDITFIRFSVGTFNHTKKDIEYAAKHIINVANQMKRNKYILKRKNCVTVTY